MFKRIAFVSMLTLASVFSSQASAIEVINTGTPSGTGGPLLVDSSNWLSGQVNFNSALSINSISAYLDDLGNGGGNFAISLYADNSNHVGALINTATATYGALGWNAASGLNWNVAAGKYWLGIEVNDFSNFVAAQGAASPLAHTAYADGSLGGSYINYDGLSFGVKVDAVTPVPEPKAYLMLLIGMLILASVAARRQSRQ